MIRYDLEIYMYILREGQYIQLVVTSYKLYVILKLGIWRLQYIRHLTNVLIVSSYSYWNLVSFSVTT